MKRKALLFSLLAFPFLSVFCQEKEVKFAFDNYHRYYKEAKSGADSTEISAMKELRARLHDHPYRLSKVDMPLSAQKCLDFLTEKGTFSDMDSTEAEFKRLGIYKKGFRTTADDKVGIFIGDALNRICCIADAYRKGKLSEEEAFSPKVLKAVTHYGMLEIRRSNTSPRFHASCFAIPTAAENIYFAWLDKMDEAESKADADTLLVAACDMLKVLGLQAYTQPLRHDETDKNVVSIERFRNHVWWVGGNALAYRPLLPVAAMYSSVPMIELLSEVCRRGISMTSQNTVGSSFWTEGFTADGAGWGHGKQCLIWGYPIDGTFNALNILGMLKGTPWEKKLGKENTEAIMNFLRGGNWYYYKGFTLPCLDRSSYSYNVTEKDIPYAKMLNLLLRDWADSFTGEERAELERLQKEVIAKRIEMDGFAPGMYSGTRWFFNNDDLIKKTSDYHLIVNMSSVRCDGLESASGFADACNFYPTDGMTLFQRNGNEYRPIMGGWDMTASPGVTAREGMERLEPVVNWRGYCSTHNFAGAATDGSNAVAGYIFEKMNASEKEGVNDRGNSVGQNEVLYGVKAYKSWFIQGDYVVALGAGITNKQPNQSGSIRTTFDQTSWVNDVYFWGKGKEEILSEGVYDWNTEKKENVWLVQEGKFAYRVLPEYGRNAFVACETRPTDWIGRNKSNENKQGLPDSVKILRLWIDHGQKPVDDTYGYVVYTGQGKPADELPFCVLRNDTLVQAVRSSDKSLLQAVFYPGNKGLSLESEEISLKVSAPCTLMLKTEGGRTCLSVTDPCMDADLKEITVTFNGRKIIVPLPQGAFCGKAAILYTDL